MLLDLTSRRVHAATGERCQGAARKAREGARREELQGRKREEELQHRAAGGPSRCNSVTSRKSADACVVLMSLPCGNTGDHVVAIQGPKRPNLCDATVMASRGVVCSVQQDVRHGCKLSKG